MADDAAIPVPFLGEARSYDVMHVAIKHKLGLLGHLMRREPRSQIVGHLNDLVATSRTSGIVNTERVATNQEFNQDYSYEFQEMRHGVFKHIKVQLAGCTQHSIRVPPGDTNICLQRKGPELQQAQKVYLITTAYCVKSLTLSVKIDRMESKVLLEGKRLPIAFTYTKYRMDRMGNLTRADIAAPPVDGHSKSLSMNAVTRVRREWKAPSRKKWVPRKFQRDPKDPLPLTPDEEKELCLAPPPRRKLFRKQNATTSQNLSDREDKKELCLAPPPRRKFYRKQNATTSQNSIDREDESLPEEVGQGSVKIDDNLLVSGVGKGKTKRRSKLPPPPPPPTRSLSMDSANLTKDININFGNK